MSKTLFACELPLNFGNFARRVRILEMIPLKEAL